MKRVYVDFNTMMLDGEHVHIRKDGLAQDDPTILPSIYRGERVTLYAEDMEVEAVVVGEEPGAWLSRPDWPTRRFL